MEAKENTLNISAKDIKNDDVIQIYISRKGSGFVGLDAKTLTLKNHYHDLNCFEGRVLISGVAVDLPENSKYFVKARIFDISVQQWSKFGAPVSISTKVILLFIHIFYKHQVALHMHYVFC